MPEVLYNAVVEVKERMILDVASCQLKEKGRKVIGKNGEVMYVQQELDMINLESELVKIRNLGISSLAVVLMHSYMFVNLMTTIKTHN